MAIDNDFLNNKGVKSEEAPQIQEEILDSMKNDKFAELNNKYDSDVIEHLCNDLVEQGRLDRTNRATMSGLQFPYRLK